MDNQEQEPSRLYIPYNFLWQTESCLNYLCWRTLYPNDQITLTKEFTSGLRTINMFTTKTVIMSAQETWNVDNFNTVCMKPWLETIQTKISFRSLSFSKRRKDNIQHRYFYKPWSLDQVTSKTMHQIKGNIIIHTRGQTI